PLTEQAKIVFIFVVTVVYVAYPSGGTCLVGIALGYGGVRNKIDVGNDKFLVTLAVNRVTYDDLHRHKFVLAECGVNFKLNILAAEFEVSQVLEKQVDTLPLIGKIALIVLFSLFNKAGWCVLHQDVVHSRIVNGVENCVDEVRLSCI